MSTAENIELTKSYITQALFALMETRPYEEISISDIVKKAGVGRATFYRHFRTKEEIVSEYFVTETRAFKDSFPESPETEDDWYELLFTAFSQLKKEKKVFRRLMDAHMEHVYMDYLNRMLSRNYSARNSAGSGYAAFHLAGSLCNVSLEWVRRDCRESVKQMTDEYFQLMFQKDFMMQI